MPCWHMLWCLPGGEMSLPSIHIRAAEPGDAAAIAGIMRCPGVVAGTLQLPFQSTEERQERMGANNPPHLHSLVAELDGRVVGSVGLHIETRPRRNHAGGIGMGVHDDVQGQGIGSALLAAVIDLADRWLNLRRLELTVFTDNAAAIHLYEKFGFEIEGTAGDYAFCDGTYADAHFMARLKR